MTTSHVRHPAPQSQFYRLDYDELQKLYVKTTRWNTSKDSANCMAAAGAIALDAHTGGRVRTTPPQIRYHQDDQSGGIGVDDVDVAWHRIAGADLLTPSDFDWNDAMHAIRVERRGVIVGVDYRYVPYSAQMQHPANFDHAIYVDDWDAGSVLRYDSLDTNPRWNPESDYRNAAEQLALRYRGTRGRLFVGLTAPRPPLNTASPHYKATVIHPTSLWNDTTDRWVYTGKNAIKVGTKLEVRGARYQKDGQPCYPVTAGKWSTKYPGYFVPCKNVALSGRA